MKKQNWIWMPHAGHLIVGNSCIFHLTTYVGKYIVSTVGEYFPDSQVREIHAEVRNIKLEGKGDDRDADFLKKCGFIDIGSNRKYETMVFKARKSKNKCCPYEIIVGQDLDFQGYNKSEEAFKGHLKMCNKWSKK